MKRLTEIGIRTKTDKAYYHWFTEVYDEYFSRFLNKPRILEVGVADFGSIAMYLEYFNDPYVVGIDVENKNRYINDKWVFKQADQANEEDLERCVRGEDLFDIIIDDGGHTMKQQQVSFGKLIQHVKPGGLYILEDVHTSFRKEYIELDCKYTTFDMLNLMKKGEKYYSNYINIDDQIEILKMIKDIEIFARNADDLTDSVTCVITLN